MGKLRGEKKLSAFILVLLIAAGTFLRLHGLGRPSLWVDEVNHVLAGRDLAAGRPPLFPSGEPNARALLYSRLVAVSFRLFGENEAAARLPSALFGILAIPLTCGVGLLFGSRRVALLAAFLVTFCHFEIGWSRLCRMYTVFQCAFLLMSWGFLPLVWRWQRMDGASLSSRRAVLHVFAGMFGLLLGMAVHLLTVEIVAILFVYVLMLALLRSLECQRLRLTRVEWLLLASGALALGAAVLMPPLRAKLLLLLRYKPGWADWGMAVDSHYYFWFLTESKRWPLLSFFVVGTLAVIARNDRRGWFWVLAFLLPVAMHTFLFAYRLSNYIFHVYPFFLIGAATGFVAVADWMAQEMTKASLWARWRQNGVRAFALFLAAGWLPLTVWFRYGIKVSRIGEAGDNGAQNHANWKGATQFVARQLRDGDAVISTLPLTVQYYLGRCDYNLNAANARADLEWTDPARVGKVDFYSGAKNIGDLDDLKAILDHTAGRVWLIADRYRFSKAGYVRPEIGEFIRQRFQLAWRDPYESIDVFCWSSTAQSGAE